MLNYDRSGARPFKTPIDLLPDYLETLNSSIKVRLRTI